MLRGCGHELGSVGKGERHDKCKPILRRGMEVRSMAKIDERDEISSVIKKLALVQKAILNGSGDHAAWCEGAHDVLIECTDKLGEILSRDHSISDLEEILKAEDINTG